MTWQAWLPQALQSWGNRGKTASKRVAASAFDLSSPKAGAELSPDSPEGTAPSARAGSPAEEPDAVPSRESEIDGLPRDAVWHSFLRQQDGRETFWRDQPQLTKTRACPPSGDVADAPGIENVSDSEEGISPSADGVDFLPVASNAPLVSGVDEKAKKYVSCGSRSGQQAAVSPAPGDPRVHPELPHSLSAPLVGSVASVKTDASPVASVTPPDGGYLSDFLTANQVPQRPTSAVAVSTFQPLGEESVSGSALSSSMLGRSLGSRVASRPRIPRTVQPLPADRRAALPHACSRTKCQHVFPPTQLTLPLPPPSWKEEEQTEQLCPLREATHLTFHVYTDMDAFELDRSLAVELLHQERIREAYLCLLPLVRTYGVDRILQDEDLCLVAYKYFEMQKMLTLLDEDSPARERMSSFLRKLRRSFSRADAPKRGSFEHGKAESLASCSETQSSLLPGRGRKESTGFPGAAAPEAETGPARRREKPELGGRGEGREQRESKGSEGCTKKFLRSRWSAGRKKQRGERQQNISDLRDDGGDRMKTSGLSSEGRGECREEFFRDSRSSETSFCATPWSPERGRAGSADEASTSLQEERFRRSTVGSGSSPLSGRTAWDSSGSLEEDGRCHERLEAALRRGVAARFSRNAGGSLSLDGTPWVLAVDDTPSVKIWNRKYHHSSLLSFRIDGLVDTPLVVVLSVLNEMDMFTDWVPSYNFPVRLGLKDAIRVAQFGRVDQLDIFKIAFPWPVNDRDACLSIWSADDLDATGSYFVRMTSCEAGEKLQGVTVPAPERGTERLHCDGALVLHPLSPNSVRVQLLWTIDPRMNLPDYLITFLTRVFARSAFHAFRRVCVAALRDSHLQRRETRSYLYRFVQDRLDALAASSVLYGRHRWSEEEASVISERKRKSYRSRITGLVSKQAHRTVPCQEQ
ncbi:putative START-1 domain protein [Toxoplasma gondii VAND]|uniref:Putative START-1 domain protein n=1 Tax=Toxoplasma gondii VAND TaxID=933077 RepID=A0A086PK17_TOXGO|nr:putative START-1 domain protein [Toxoplasma gondii VAND]